MLPCKEPEVELEMAAVRGREEEEEEVEGEEEGGISRKNPEQQHLTAAEAPKSSEPDSRLVKTR